VGEDHLLGKGFMASGTGHAWGCSCSLVACIERLVEFISWNEWSLPESGIRMDGGKSFINGCLRWIATSHMCAAMLHERENLWENGPATDV
jgi:hypothetical protein